MSSRQSGRRKPKAEINVVPYIDVTLVLLIIFMVTAPMLQTGVEVDLPQADTETAEQQNDPPVIVSIDREGRFYVDMAGQESQEMGADEMTATVADVLRDKPAIQVFIRGDKFVDYGKVISAMAALKNAGVPKVGLMTQPYQH
ncbi:protein TolR [Methylotuvimicrobium alcaliphilum]|uniref:Tol-Pal system protein TolR n=1 Tax=Methylotuvimicrobium alcaliphilum (strain DSM 19304 / NCIMB 14124 / VKM B-2133 / 20Z) TaxID=1091494 RepID=G4ST23_META2|nr:protein TolR [Methylotuvimicrobium alcaliphilum]CCE22733.1 biopolymer transport protein ExbD/TolR [Methylotuvimicrobium alcaliphilum 20Z]